MSATTENAVHVGEETTYGVAVTPDRSLAVTGLSDDVEVTELQHNEIVKDQVAGAVGSHEYLYRAVSGTIESNFKATGMGLWLKAAVGNSTISGTVQTHEVVSAESPTSLTMQVVKSARDGAKVYTYNGLVISSWGLEHSPGDVLKASADFFSAQSLDRATSEAVAAYPAASSNFSWREADFTIDGQTIKGLGFSLSVDNNLDTDRDYLALVQPRACRTGKVAASINVTAPVNNDTEALLTKALSGTPIALDFTWTKGSVAQETFNVNAPVAIIKPNSGSISLDDITQVELEFMVLDPTSGSPLTLTYDTKVDTAF